MHQYHELLKYILKEGCLRKNRTQIDSLSIFGYQMRFSLKNAFPLLTTKKVHIRSIIYELLWFLKGHSNIGYLKKNNVTIWDEWADQDGELGPIYGVQWRSWRGIDGNSVDQISKVIEDIKTTPNSRRLIVSAWNVAEIDKMKLPPCHVLFQFFVQDGALSCQLYQRSADVFLGVPFNIASYALLVYMVAQVCNLKVGEFIHTLGDAHIYLNHIEQVKSQISREVRPLPQIYLNPKIKNIFDFTYADFTLVNYDPHPTIHGDVAI